MINNFIFLKKKVIEKKIAISALCLGVILVSLIAIAFAQTTTLFGGRPNAACLPNSQNTITPSWGLVPELIESILINREGEDTNKHRITLKLKNSGESSWFNRLGVGGERYYIKITSVSSGGPTNLIGTRIALRDNDAIIPQTVSLNRDIASFELPEQVNPTNAGPITIRYKLFKEKIYDDGTIDFAIGQECTFNYRADSLNSQCEGANSISVFAEDFINEDNRESFAITPEQRYVVKVKLRNMGSTAWSAIRGFELEGKINERAVTVPLGNLANNQPKTANPGGIIEIEYRTDAPVNPGVLETEWQMKFADQLFGNVCRKTIRIENPRNDAVCEELNLQLSQDSRDLNIRVKMRNTGNTVWRQNYNAVVPEENAGLLRLGFTEIENPLAHPVSGVAFVYRTPPQRSFTTITKTVRLADLSPQPNFGSYDIAFRMKKGNEEFGQICRRRIDIKPRFVPAPPGATVTRNYLRAGSGTESGDSP